MVRRSVVGVMVLVAMAAVASGGGPQRGRGGFRGFPGGFQGFQGFRGGLFQRSEEMTIEQQRKLGLSDEQIQKIAEKRRDLEKERAGIEAQLEAAQEAARVAAAKVAELNGQVREITTVRLVKLYESLMTEDQVKAYRQQRYLDEAKRDLAGYRRWLNLTDAQVEDIAHLVAPVYEKYDKLEQEAEAATEELAKLRRAEKIDVDAIDKAEKRVAEFAALDISQKRRDEVREKMRAGLLPEQLERLDARGGRGGRPGGGDGGR